MINKRFWVVLGKISERLSAYPGRWLIVGSCNLALQGLPIDPQDIDISTDQNGAYEIERLFSEYILHKVKYSSGKAIRSHFGTLMIDGVKIELMGDLEIKDSFGAWQRTTIKRITHWITVNSLQLPVASLESEYQGYQWLGRFKRAELIRNWLESKQKKDFSD
ncbi:MAG: nucleotidyltransferase domain-containing protein [Candidatus Hodarchaeota archaeon]